MKKTTFILFLGLAFYSFSKAQQGPGNSSSGNLIHVDKYADVKNADWTNPPVPNNLMQVSNQIWYPEAARKAGIEGTVLVSVKVDALGNATGYQVLKSPDDLLTKAVTDQILNLKFSNFQSSKADQVFWVTIPFKFALNP